MIIAIIILILVISAIKSGSTISIHPLRWLCHGIGCAVSVIVGIFFFGLVTMMLCLVWLLI